MIFSLPPLPLDLRQWQHSTEKNLLEQALKESRYNQKMAAEKLALSYDQLRGLIKKTSHKIVGLVLYKMSKDRIKYRQKKKPAPELASKIILEAM